MFLPLFQAIKAKFCQIDSFCLLFAVLLMLCFCRWVTDFFSPKKEWAKHAKNSIHVYLCLELHNVHSFKFGSRNTRFQSSKYVRQKCKQLSVDLYGFSGIISLFSYSQITSVTQTFFLINIGIVNGKKCIIHLPSVFLRIVIYPSHSYFSKISATELIVVCPATFVMLILTPT